MSIRSPFQACTSIYPPKPSQTNTHWILVTNSPYVERFCQASAACGAYQGKLLSKESVVVASRYSMRTTAVWPVPLERKWTTR